MPHLPFILLACYILFVITWPITVLLHELGHGIPALILTKREVTLYIGSYGKVKGSFLINLGRLKLYFKFNPFAWRAGLCKYYSTNISVTSHSIILLTGPITSLLLSVILCYIAFSFEFHGSLKLILVAFVVSSLLDLLTNIIPDEKPIYTLNGNATYNDGYQLKLLFKYRHLYKKFSNQPRFMSKNTTINQQ